jgi:hypothetical protein
MSMTLGHNPHRTFLKIKGIDMNYAVEEIYKNGNVELLEMPEFDKPVGVLVIFPENRKKIGKLGGLFKDFTVSAVTSGSILKS